MRKPEKQSPVDRKAKKEFDRRLGQYLRKVRISRGYSQVEMAKITAATPQFFSNIERGKCSVPPHLLRAMIGEYQIDFNEFLEFLSALKMNYYRLVLSQAKGKKDTPLRCS